MTIFTMSMFANDDFYVFCLKILEIIRILRIVILRILRILFRFCVNQCDISVSVPETETEIIHFGFGFGFSRNRNRNHFSFLEFRFFGVSVSVSWRKRNSEFRSGTEIISVSQKPNFFDQFLVNLVGATWGWVKFGQLRRVRWTFILYQQQKVK